MRIRVVVMAVSLAVLLGVALAPGSFAQDKNVEKGADGSADKSNDISFQKFVLDNGLTVIVHDDHIAPIVAINTWYHVGSKNEKPGKTGFAHLFEHLMFGERRHAPGREFAAW